MNLITKKLTSGLLIPALLLSVFCLYRCSSAPLQPTTPPASTEKVTKVLHVEEEEPDEAKYNETLEALVYGLLEISQDLEFRHIVNQEVEKQFDGDDNVLFRVLDAAAHEADIEMKSAFQKAIEAHASEDPEQYLQLLDGAIQGFDYFEEKAYPQIYIPFVEQVDLEAKPIIALNIGEGGSEIPAYQLNADGRLSEQMIDEAYAKENLVWVVSMNESIDSEQELDEHMNPSGQETLLSTTQADQPDRTPTNSTGSREWAPESVGRIYLERIKIIDKKEPWYNGRCDFSCAYLHFQMPPSPGNYPCTPTVNNFEETRYYDDIVNVSNSQLNTWITGMYIAFADDPNNNLDIRTEVTADEGLFLLFWEKDKKNKFRQEFSYVSTCNDFTYSVVSKEPIYGATTNWSRPVTLTGNTTYLNPTYTTFPTTNQSLTSEDEQEFDYSGNIFVFKYTSNN